MSEIFNEKTIFWMLLGLAVFLILYVYLHRRKHHKLRLVIHFSNNKNPFGMSLNTVTLTDLLPHTGVISVVDQTGAAVPGTLSNFALVVADPTIDKAAIDANQANTVDVTAIASAGGTTVAITADFTSASPINGQTSFPGLKGIVTIINQVASQVQLSLAVNF